MFNKVVLVGNLARDIEVRSTPSGTMIGATAIAVTRKYNDANGEKREETCFIDITFFSRLAEIANLYLRKGSKLLVEGRLKQDSWVDQNGNKRSKHSIVVENMEMLGGNPQASEGGYSNSAQSNYAQPSYANTAYSANSYDKDDYYKQPQAKPNNIKNDIKTIDLDESDDSEDLPF